MIAKDWNGRSRHAEVYVPEGTCHAERGRTNMNDTCRGIGHTGRGCLESATIERMRLAEAEKDAAAAILGRMRVPRPTRRLMQDMLAVGKAGRRMQGYGVISL